MPIQHGCPHNKVLIALKRAIVATFNEEQWLELGYLAGNPQAVEQHPRLLRSLQFGDDDYGGCALSVLKDLLGSSNENMNAIERFVRLDEWLGKNDASLHEELYGPEQQATQEPFSVRYGHVENGSDREITIREDAPPEVRQMIVEIALKAGAYDYDELVWLSGDIGKQPWELPSPISNSPSHVELKHRMSAWPWYLVYDFVETIHSDLAGKANAAQDYFPDEKFAFLINQYFRHAGVGWKLCEGRVVVRGAESFELSVQQATEALSDRPTAKSQLHEALAAISRRPVPNLSGAVFHAMGALECVARDVTGDPKSTLGQVLKRNPGLLPQPLDSALAQIWGFASNEARHVVEGRQPDQQEAELIVGLAGNIASYLSKKVRP